jgi:hypothetical protein
MTRNLAFPEHNVAILASPNDNLIFLDGPTPAGFLAFLHDQGWNPYFSHCAAPPVYYGKAA